MTCKLSRGWEFRYARRRDRAEGTRCQLVQSMKDAMDAVVNFTEPLVLIEVEESVSKTWEG